MASVRTVLHQAFKNFQPPKNSFYRALQHAMQSAIVLCPFRPSVHLSTAGIVFK